MSAASTSTRAEIAVLAWFALAACVGFVFLSSILPVVAVPVAAASTTGAYALRRRWRGPRRLDRVLGFAAIALLAIAHALWLYLALSWGLGLAWTIPAWGWALVTATAVLAAATLVRPFRGARLPLTLPLTLFVSLGLLGWETEESRLRCDDYLALQRSADATLLVPTSTRVSECAPGEVIAIGRYPRFPWQSADGAITLFTTSARGPIPERADLPMTGSICRVGERARIDCVGSGKAQGIAESIPLDRIFVASWSRFAPGVRGRVQAIRRTGPFEVIDTLDVASSLGDFFYDPRADRLYGFTDEGSEIIPVTGATLHREHTVTTSLLPPGAIVYDAGRGEGLVCVTSGPASSIDGSSFLAVATHGNPLSLRPIGASALARFSLSWGCDYDRSRRIAFVALPNLGLLARLDYDSGEILDTAFVGFDVRGVTVDGPRERIYLTMFLSGQIVAIDMTSMQETARWRVGRFPRRALVSTDGESLLVGTTLGLASIALGPVAR